MAERSGAISKSFGLTKGISPSDKSYQVRMLQKYRKLFVQNRQICQLPFCPAAAIIKP